MIALIFDSVAGKRLEWGSALFDMCFDGGVCGDKTVSPARISL
jgi:hypothetical protein